MNSSAVIDLDGTLSDNRHRLHYIEGEEKNWEKYYSAAEEDEVIEVTRERVKKLSESHRIVILTARADSLEDKTREWLDDKDIPFQDLIMLENGRWDISDPDYKREELEQIGNPKLAIDDKEDVCEMFKDCGLKVYRVEYDGSPEINEF